METTLLNTIAETLNTTDKNLVISATLKNLIELGQTPKQAIETVFGKEGAENLAGQIYDILNA
jgi:hypothetical protein